MWRGCGGGNTQAKRCYGHDEPAWWVEGGEREGRRREGGAPRGEAGREAGTEHGDQVDRLGALHHSRL